MAGDRQISGSLVAAPLGCRLEAQFGEFVASASLRRRERLGARGRVVVDARPRVVDGGVTPPTEDDGDLVGGGRVGAAAGTVAVRSVRGLTFLVRVGEVVLFEERATVAVGVAARFETAPGALAFVAGRAVVGAVAPLAVAGRGGTAVVRARAFGGEVAIVFGVLEGVAALAVPGDVIADPGVRVGVVHAHGGPGRRLLHRLVLAPGAAKRLRAPRRVKRADAVVRGVRVVHDRGDETAVLASEVDVADSFLSRARGLMFRTSIPAGYALVFEFDEPKRRDVHMVFVPFAIDVLWLVDDEVQRVETLSAWTGLDAAEADRLIELPAGAAAGVRVGDTVRVA
ncbi:hypothetical protein MBEHAL_0832 [Halarchaeum acidiphilum MH1-52-1]|uniref:DUF192 domain-containing protein n=1 Tax=Halarchaeum acidiphilum MH1-52-1 TaxID=1261545 RepID=U2YTI8_9EURY|nr:hypothetical protein MBEHAL_0832 [Halarchaeum acidiphilum MH1-52-1]